MKKYELFIGLNDKNTKKQEIATEKAIEFISKECIKKFGGCSLSIVNGIYTHANGKIVYENTIKLEIITDNERDITNIAEYTKKALNQESICFSSYELNQKSFNEIYI